jgi:hypothetical protein
MGDASNARKGKNFGLDTFLRIRKGLDKALPNVRWICQTELWCNHFQLGTNEAEVLN